MTYFILRRLTVVLHEADDALTMADIRSIQPNMSKTQETKMVTLSLIQVMNLMMSLILEGSGKMVSITLVV